MYKGSTKNQIKVANWRNIALFSILSTLHSVKIVVTSCTYKYVLMFVQIFLQYIGIFMVFRYSYGMTVCWYKIFCLIPILVWQKCLLCNFILVYTTLAPKIKGTDQCTFCIKACGPCCLGFIWIYPCGHIDIPYTMKVSLKKGFMVFAVF